MENLLKGFFYKSFNNFSEGFGEIVNLVGSLYQAFADSLSAEAIGVKCDPNDPGRYQKINDTRDEFIKKLLSGEDDESIFEEVFQSLLKNTSYGNTCGCPAIRFERHISRMFLEYETSGGLTFGCLKEYPNDEWVFYVIHPDRKNIRQGVCSDETVYFGEDRKGSSLRYILTNNQWEEGDPPWHLAPHIINKYKRRSDWAYEVLNQIKGGNDE